MVDTVSLELVNNRLDEVVREMQHSIFRTGYSTVIRESKDTSAGIATRDGRVVGQQFRHPFHIGVFPPAIDGLYEYFDSEEIEKGDIFIMNDPYVGGSPHSSDIIVLNPVFNDDRIVAFTMNIAHKPDIGGLVPGTSSGEARSLYHEGIQFPPVKIESDGKLNQDIINILRNNSRDPDVTAGDLRGQVGCTKVGKRELLSVFEEHGTETVLACFDELIGSLREQLLGELTEWPTETYYGEAFMDIPADTEEWAANLGPDEQVRIDLSVENTGEELVFDFTDSDDQTHYPINLRPHIVRAVCYYAIVGLIDSSLPLTSAIGEICKIKTSEGSVLDPQRPAPVNFYIYPLNTVTNVTLRTLSQFDEDILIADSSENLGFSFGGKADETSVQYEFLFGGYGGTARGDGATGVVAHTTNLEIVPIEVVESEFPDRVNCFEVIPDSEGAGEHRGAFGVRREYSLESDMTFVYRPKTSNVVPPQGIDGGKSPEIVSGCYITEEGSTRRLPTITSGQNLKTGDQVCLELHGGGGCGDPMERDPEAVLQDYQDGFITAERAETVYGVRINTKTYSIEDVIRE